MTPRDAPPLSARELAGYRVLRSLARDEQAELLLGHRVIAAPTEEGDAADPAAESPRGTRSETVALKVMPATSEGWETVLRLGEVLERARGAHVVDWLDVDADEQGIRLVFERLTRGDLASLLALRPSWDAGEAVTVLAPVVTTVQRLHAAGVAHGALSARTVMFREDGAPTLIGFSAAELFEPGAPEVVLEEIAAVIRDREAIRGISKSVLERVAGTRARAARELLAELAEVDTELLLPFLASRLFGVAAALPVRFTADQPASDAAIPAPRAVPIAAASRADPVPGAESDERAASGLLAGVLARLVPEPLVQRVLDAAERSPAAPVARAIGRRWTTWSSARRRSVLAAGSGALTIAVVTAVVPAAGASSRAASVIPTPVESAATGSPWPRADAPALVGDDPLAAASALLAARDRCLASLSLPCLDGVDEAGSGALEDDRAAIRAGETGGELPDPAVSGAASGAPVLIQRLGDSALVRLSGAASGQPTADAASPSTAASANPSPNSGPASLLLVKGEAGWRIRDVIAAGERSS